MKPTQKSHLVSADQEDQHQLANAASVSSSDDRALDSTEWTGCPAQRVLWAFTAGTLPAEASENVANHIENCPACQQTLEQQGPEELADDVQQLLANLANDASALSRASQEELAALLALRPNEVPPLCQLSTCDRLHEYQLLEEIGHGGMGTVFRAVHRRLNKQVAIKTIAPSAFAIPDTVRRFESEMRALGELSHPNIVQASDAGVYENMHYLVMEYIDGVNLAGLCKRQGPLDIPLVVHVLKEVSAALDCAHRHGLVHRDVKPSNIMVVPSATGKCTVKLLDLGLSALHHASSDLPSSTVGQGATVSPTELDPGQKQTNPVVGTFDYMAPEQAKRDAVPHPAMDLYSLGCTCFHLLVGYAPYRLNAQPSSATAPNRPLTPKEKLQAHAHWPVPEVKTLRPDVPQWLNDLVRRLMSKDPADRPASATEVQAIVLQAETSQKRERPRVNMLVALAALVGLVLLGVVVRVSTDKGTLEIVPLDEAVDVVVSQDGRQVKVVDTRNTNTIELRSGKFQLSVNDREDVTIDRNAIELKRGQKVVVRLDFKPTASPKTDASTPVFRPTAEVFAAILSAKQAKQSFPGLLAVLGNINDVDSVDGMPVKNLEFSPDGTWLAAASSWIGRDETASPGELRIFDARDGRLVHRLSPHTSGINKVAWTKDNQVVFSGGYDGHLVATHAETGKTIRDFEFDGSVACMALSDSGRLLAASCNHTVYVIQWPDGNVLHKLKVQGPGVEDIAFRGENQLISNGFESPNHVWTIEPQPQLKTYRLHPSISVDLAIPHDASQSYVWTGDYAGQCVKWNSEDGKILKQLRHPWVVSSVSLSPDDKQVLTSDWYGSVRLWDADTLKLLRVISGRGESVARFHPSGRSIAVGSNIDTVQMLDIETGQPVWPVANTAMHSTTDKHSHYGLVDRIAVSPDNKVLASAAVDGSVVLWDANSFEQLTRLDHVGGQAVYLQFQGSGQRLTTVTHEAFMTEWDVKSRKVLNHRMINSNPGCRVIGADFASNSNWLATLNVEGVIELWDLAQQQSVRTFKLGPSVANQLLFTADGKLLWATDRGRLRCWEAATGNEQKVDYSGNAHSLALAENRVLVANQQNKVSVLDASGRKLYDFQTPHGQISRLQIDPGGRELCVSSIQSNSISQWLLQDSSAKLNQHFQPVPAEMFGDVRTIQWDTQQQRYYVGHRMGVVLVVQHN